MAIFAPGVAQGALGAMEYSRQADIDKQLAAQRKQAMEYQAYQMETSRAQEAARLRNAEQAGALLTPPPPVAQTPSPGQSSQPMQPPGMRPPAPPMFSQGQGMGQQPPQMVTPGAQQAMQPPQPQPIPPYRSLAQQGQGMPQPNPQARGDMQPPGAPPPVGGTPMAPAAAPKQSPVGMLEQLIARMDQQGVPAADRIGVLAQLSPIVKENANEQLLQMREKGIEMTAQMRELKLMLDQEKEMRLAGEGQRRLAQGDKRIELSAQRLQAARQKAASGAAPQSTDLADREEARVWYDIFKEKGTPPQFAMGDKAGKAAWRKWVATFAKEDGMSGGDIAAEQGGYKGAVSANRNLEVRRTNVEQITGALEKVDSTIVPLAKKINTSFAGEAGNRVLNDLSSKYGDNRELQQLNVLAKTYGREYIKAVTAAGSNAQMLATHKEDADALVNGNMPVNKLLGAIDGMKLDIKAFRDSMADEQKRVKANMGGTGSGAAATGQDAEAIAWAKANPSDPRAAQILKLHGM